MPRAAVLLIAVLAIGCNKPSAEQCSKGCKNYFQLHYWAAADKVMQKTAVEMRVGMRAFQEVDFIWRELYQLPLCTQKCISGADPHRAKCWETAKTVPESEACANDD